MKHKPIYVEIPIHAKMDELWHATQNPKLHEQWDVRFSSITYLPKEEGKPQLFSYKTKIGFGIEIAGWGKSVGSHHAENDSRTSSLHFGTDQKISIIREGRGYWKYIPKEDGSITFLTQYNYEPSFGRIGSLIDHYIFRPLIGWGTALSFDVLKRWLEKEESPASQFLRFFSIWILSFFFMFLWMYHGLIPKLLFMHPDEVTMITNTIPLTFEQGKWIVYIAGILELAFGFLWLFYRNKKQLFTFQIIIFPLLTLGAVIAEPGYLIQPFNPLTFNMSLFVLSVIGFLLSKNVPTAKSCKRTR
ncbi:DoxX-like family protein [Oceanobacillus limi]|uniref:DoxX-like family protein n=1 Tax=Oceanobacillus limi TaxID=930131 RepID=A0A1I0D4W3_9BACI|nr:DoxX-like family protein [Oceanobacillus limi]SET27287.1 DoxX-like family protein [Oceanobacillus limi]